MAEMSPLRRRMIEDMRIRNHRTLGLAIAEPDEPGRAPQATQIEGCAVAGRRAASCRSSEVKAALRDSPMTR